MFILIVHCGNMLSCMELMVIKDELCVPSAVENSMLHFDCSAMLVIEVRIACSLSLPVDSLALANMVSASRSFGGALTDCLH